MIKLFKNIEKDIVKVAISRMLTILTLILLGILVVFVLGYVIFTNVTLDEFNKGLRLLTLVVIFIGIVGSIVGVLLKWFMYEYDKKYLLKHGKNSDFDKYL